MDIETTLKKIGESYQKQEQYNATYDGRIEELINTPYDRK